MTHDPVCLILLRITLYTRCEDCIQVYDSTTLRNGPNRTCRTTCAQSVVHTIAAAERSKLDGTMITKMRRSVALVLKVDLMYTVIEGPLLLFFLTPQLNLLFLAESMKYTEWVDAFVACCPVPSFRFVFCWDGVAVTFHCSPWSKTTTHPYTSRFYRHCKDWCLLPVLERTLFVACLDCFLACTGHSIGVESPYRSVVSPLKFLWLIETYWDILRHIETHLKHIETYWDMIEKV